MQALCAIVAVLVFFLTSSCHMTSKAAALSMEAALADPPTRTYDSEDLFEGLVEPAVAGDPAQAWEIGAPSGLRPCCALGHNLSVTIGPVPLPLFRIVNVVDSTRLGRHRYNSGLLSFGVNPKQGVGFREQNGLVYTCGSGLVDTAHIRDYTDLTVYLYEAILPHVGSDAEIRLPEDGGERIVHLAAIDDATVAKIGRQELALAMAGYAAFELSVWHELASWYGWTHVPLFPETVSAFSPEDLYTNILGIRLAFEMVKNRRTGSQEDYEAAMDAAIPQLLSRLGEMPAPLSHAVLSTVDGSWWDSSQRLPRFEVVKVRSFDLGPELHPLRVDPSDLGASLGKNAAAFCSRWEDRPVVLRVPQRAGTVDLARNVTIEVVAAPALAAVFPFPRADDRSLTQKDFPAIVAALAEESERPLLACLQD